MIDAPTLETIEKEEKRPFVRALHILTIGYFIGLGIIGLLIYQASPSPVSEEIRGVAIGDWQDESGVAYLSGRRLDCQEIANNPPFATHCEVEIDGEVLQIDAYRNDPSSNMMLSGGCEASYNGQEWPCEIGSRHVHVHWFTFIKSPLGLSNDQMDGLRQKYFIENLSETPFITFIFASSIVTTLLVLINGLIWLEPKIETKIYLVFWGLLIAGITFVISFYSAIVVTNGFWD